MAEDRWLASARQIRQEGLAADRSQVEIIDKIHNQCDVSLLRAHRLARGWTLQETASRIRQLLESGSTMRSTISHQRVSQWEKGLDVPTPRYLDALCKLYSTRPDLLGFGHDYTLVKTTGQIAEPANARLDELQVYMPLASADSQLGLTNPRPRGADGLDSYGVTTIQANGGDDEVKRRDLLLALASQGYLLAAEPLFEALKKVRIDADVLLESQSVTASGVDRWEAVAHEYGYSIRVADPHAFLAEAMFDFVEVRKLLSRRQPMEFQRRLYRVAGQLAGLIACNVNAVGNPRETRAWFNTARLAAEEAGDRQLRSWVIAYEAMTHLWYGRPAEHALELSQTASAVAGSKPSSSGALAASIEARAYAKLGRCNEAIDAIKTAEFQWEMLDESATDGNVLGFYEHLLRFYQGNVLATVGSHSEMEVVSSRALELSPSKDATDIDSSLIKLDRAVSLMGSGEPEEASRLAIVTFLALSPGFRSGTAAFKIQELAGSALLGGHRRVAANLSEVLNSQPSISQ